ncbi:MAG: hypothetical protein CVV00_10030 [Firmicutes bacterium HGW-Firmicutes-5]|nr:MAG: hypothetical protein CVV00_10030 [Firmicutes bacterium HGW-Firmicutes-5]
MRKVDFTGSWIFVCNPKYWDIQNFLLDLKAKKIDRFDSWSIPEWQIEAFKPEQYGVIRVGHDTRTKKVRKSNPKLERGIYALVKVVSFPKVKSGDVADAYNLSEEATYMKKSYYVELEYIANLIDKPFLLEEMKHNEVFANDPYLIDGFQASSISLAKESLVEIMKSVNIATDTYEDIEASQNLSQTEKEIIISTRLGHSKLRRQIFEERKVCSCEICSVDDEHLLVISHIKSWALSNNKERLDKNNILLLCPNHDKLFDSGYITFDNSGQIIISGRLTNTTILAMTLSSSLKIRMLNPLMKEYLKWHRENIFMN